MESALRVLLDLPPSRVWAVPDGLTPGLLFIPLEEDQAWFGTRPGPLPSPIQFPNPTDFVFSYGFHDIELASLLQADLRAAGLTSYLLDASPGQDQDPVWWLRFRVAMANASHVLPLISDDYLQREGTLREAEEFWRMFYDGRERSPLSPIVPLLAPGSAAALLRDHHALLSRLPAVDISTPEGREIPSSI